MKIPSNITPQTNNFDFLRLVSAFLVFLGHAILISNVNNLQKWNGGLAISSLGVNTFFIISGFLITKSWLDSDNFRFFTLKRFLRIYPGLIFAGLVTVLILGPTTTLFSIDQYFQSSSTWNYLVNIFSFNLIDLRNNVLPGVFATNKLQFIVNASLWTIPIEIFCYFLVAAFGLAKLFQKRTTFLWMLILFLIFGALSATNKNVAIFLQDNTYILLPDILRLVTYFVFGIVLYLYRESVWLSKKYILLFLVAFSVLTALGNMELASYFLLPVFVLALGFAKINFPKKITAYGDFSYGFYLFAFPIQQSVSYFLSGHISPVLQTLIAFFLVLFLAIISWKLIEKPCLKFKQSCFATSHKNNCKTSLQKTL